MNHRSVYDILLPKVEQFAAAQSLPLARGGQLFTVPETAWMRATYEPSIQPAENVSLGGKHVRNDSGLAVSIYQPTSDTDPDGAALAVCDLLIDTLENQTLNSGSGAVRVQEATVSRPGVSDTYPGHVQFTVGFRVRWDRQR